MADEFAPAAAEHVIRRAIEIDEERSQRIPLAEIKATLATLGIAGETVETAAAEVRKELQEISGLRTPMEWLGELAAFALVTLPGVWLVASAGEAKNALGTALMLGAGGGWVLLMLGMIMDRIHGWLRARRNLA